MLPPQVITRREIHQQALRAKELLGKQEEREALETRRFHLEDRSHMILYYIILYYIVIYIYIYIYITIYVYIYIYIYTYILLLRYE